MVILSQSWNFLSIRIKSKCFKCRRILLTIITANINSVISSVRIRLQATGWQPSCPCKKLGDNLWEIAGTSEEEIPAIVKQIVAQGGKFYHISSELPSLEDVYFHLTSGKKEDSDHEI